MSNTDPVEPTIGKTIRQLETGVLRNTHNGVRSSLGLGRVSWKRQHVRWDQKDEQQVRVGESQQSKKHCQAWRGGNLFQDLRRPVKVPRQPEAERCESWRGKAGRGLGCCHAESPGEQAGGV